MGRHNTGSARRGKSAPLQLGLFRHCWGLFVAAGGFFVAAGGLSRRCRGLFVAAGGFPVAAGGFPVAAGGFSLQLGAFSLQLGDFLVALRRQLAPARISWQDSLLLPPGLPLTATNLQAYRDGCFAFPQFRRVLGLAPRCSKPESCHENEPCAKGCLMSSPLFAPFFAGNQREGGRGDGHRGDGDDEQAVSRRR